MTGNCDEHLTGVGHYGDDQAHSGGLHHLMCIRSSFAPARCARCHEIRSAAAQQTANGWSSYTGFSFTAKPEWATTRKAGSRRRTARANVSAMNGPTAA